ncbi:carbon-nitrogen hydrolase family protein [Marinomonas sp.]
MSSLVVAAIQLTSMADWRENLDKVTSLLLAAVKDGARLIVLPENVFLFNGKRMREMAASQEQTLLLEAVAELAKKHSVYIVIGSHPSLKRPTEELVDMGRVRQRCWLLGPDGELITSYDKIHLFDVQVDDKAASYRESNFIEPGEIQLQVVEIDGFKLGLSICYDLRFPELYRSLAKLGAELVVVPAAFTYVTGKAHWNTLLAARAIENQCYVLGVNQCGWHNALRQTYGHSSLYSPNGECLAMLEEKPGYFVYRIERQALTEVRAKMPCLTHRRM